MPDTFRSFHTNHHAGPPYATYIGQELPDRVERTFPAIPARHVKLK